ncbi:MAG: GntR family transcriptional regulator [Lentisphaeria bacterium]|nr:GntR family transcriptional regulator [Lentisphaeria bacterium]
MMKHTSVSQNKNDSLFRELQEAIRGGRFPAGTRIPTERELAMDYACSRATVRSSLRKLEELNFIERVRGSGTYVRESCEREQELCYRVAIFLEGKGAFGDDDPYFGRILYGLFQDGKMGFLPEIHQVRTHDVLPWSELDLGNYAGLIVGFQMSPAECADLERNGIPFVALEKPEADSTVSYVAVDNHAGAGIATEHLIESGRRNPLFLCGQISLHMNRNKTLGFFEALDRAGISAEPERVIEIVPYDENETARIIQRELPKRSGFDSLLIDGDWATWATVNYLRERGLRIPEDVAVIMYDEFNWVSRALALPVTSVRQPHAEQLRTALRLLMRKLHDAHQPQVIQTIQPTLLVRRSSMAY